MIGFIVMTALKSKQQPEFFAPLSFGRGNEPGPEMLLRRDRATIFASVNEAEKALENSVTQAEAEGASWPRNYQFVVIEAEFKE